MTDVIAELYFRSMRQACNAKKQWSRPGQQIDQHAPAQCWLANKQLNDIGDDDPYPHTSTCTQFFQDTRCPGKWAVDSGTADGLVHAFCTQGITSLWARNYETR